MTVLFLSCNSYTLYCTEGWDFSAFLRISAFLYSIFLLFHLLVTVSRICYAKREKLLSKEQACHFSTNTWNSTFGRITLTNYRVWRQIFFLANWNFWNLSSFLKFFSYTCLKEAANKLSSNATKEMCRAFSISPLKSLFFSN